MRKLRSIQPGDLWLVIAAGSIWGTIGVATQAIYNTDTTTSLFINLGRMVIAAPVLLLVCRRVVGRKIASLPDYRFSKALKGMNIVWTPETVAKLFEVGPNAYTPGTKMPEQRIGSPEDRKALTDFLARATAK